MKQLLKLLSLSSAIAAGASAQSYSQPVRDVDAGVRSGVYGSCSLTVSPGYSGSALTECTMSTAAGQNLQSMVPSGKILIVVEASTACRKNAVDDWESVFLAGSTGRRLLPLTLQGSNANGQVWVSQTTGRLQFGPNQIVRSFFGMMANAQHFAGCTISFTGYLVDAQ